ncbi:YihY/virulence factor BrkB family protein [Adhaeribacter aquaticus]|uniref:YihY/virulence factor BrkB family protein n=1 Tax=Adhaeribacter aquaticus TaxID=299567 RepID=UPI00040EB4FD|nr:YihY/virulence factor BrkB family protein [Adhaeribacter aquaticus]
MLFITPRIFKAIWHLFRETVLEFLENNALDKGAALSYYTIFALPPILIIIINTIGIIFGQKAVSGEIYYQIKGLIGAEGAYEVQKMVENISKFSGLTFATLIGIATLLVTATGLFVTMQTSLNAIWGVKPKPKREYLKLITDRLLSFAMILSITFLLLVSLIVHALLARVGNYLLNNIGETAIILIHFFNSVFSLAVVTFLFAAIYKFLPDAKIQWRDVWVGSIVTALLFTFGKYLIGLYLGNSNLATVYGAAGTVVVILTWVYYSSQILYFGSIFTLIYSRKYGSNIYPSEYAVRVKVEEIEAGKTAVNKEPGKFEQPEE